MIYAFFDFDGTLTTKDTLKGFARYYWGKSFKWKLLCFLPMLLAFRLKLINHDQAKALFIRAFYKKVSVSDLRVAGNLYARDVIPTIEQKPIIERLNWHINQGHEVCIVTASLPYWIEAWCIRKGVKLLSTQAEEVNGCITGHLDGPNCYGHEKVKKIKQTYDLNSSDRVYAYGDTASDYPMMDMANAAFDCSNKTHSSYTLARKEPWYAEAI